MGVRSQVCRRVKKFANPNLKLAALEDLLQVQRCVKLNCGICCMLQCFRWFERIYQLYSEVK
ncbi:hypothetical protein SLS58_007400 [Diplodia intermedia]|uniref:Uncharacterized protein n=1 Tax=Diplodia intermedia TaxID=856260 RepID=A0ABR3TK96_9PEZI